MTEIHDSVKHCKVTIKMTAIFYFKYYGWNNLNNYIIIYIRASCSSSSNIRAAVKSEMLKIKVQPRFCLVILTTTLMFVLPVLFSFLPSEWYILFKNLNCWCLYKIFCRLGKKYFEDSDENFKYILLWNTFFEDDSFGLK